MGLVSDIQIHCRCDISAFYFGADFSFNIGLYDNFFITCQVVGYYATCNGYFIKPIYIN